MKKQIKKEVAQAQSPAWMNLGDKFEFSFDHKVRIFRNLRMEKENSYCAAPGTTLKFEKMKIDDNQNVLFRVRRTGRNTFYTTSEQILANQLEHSAPIPSIKDEVVQEAEVQDEEVQ